VAVGHRVLQRVGSCKRNAHTCVRSVLHREIVRCWPPHRSFSRQYRPRRFNGQWRGT
jgi:hypothetical protein